MSNLPDCDTCKHWDTNGQYKDYYGKTRAMCWRLELDEPDVAHDFYCVYHEEHRREND